MTDNSNRDSNLRKARASGKIFLKEGTIDRIRNNFVQKGDVETIARIAAINAVKKTPELIPLCPKIPISAISVDMNFQGKTCINVSCTVKSVAKTGVEVQALTGVNVALLNIWEAVKMYEKDEKGHFPSSIITSIKIEEEIKQKEFE